MRAGDQDPIDDVVEAVRTGKSAAVVVRDGSAADWPTDFRVAHIAGAASEVALHGAGVHQLGVQLLDQVDRLSPSQQEVLRRAFDPSAPDEDPSAVALTLFSLLAGAAESGPVICVVRRPGQLDDFSRAVLAVTARRLVAESIALLFAVEDDVPHELAGLRQLPAARSRFDAAVTAG